MISRSWRMLPILSGLLVLWSADSHAETRELTFPGKPALCEASAAVLVDCPKTGGDCLLVGDNEIKDRLFLFRIMGGEGGVRLEAERAMRFPESMLEIEDIEALIRLPSGDVLIYGSHGRNKKCRRDKKRRRFAQVALSSDGLQPKAEGRSGKHRCDRLFGSGYDGVLKAVCDVVERTESKADDARDARNEVRACEKDPAINIEGAVFVPGKGVWIGLRAPLVEGRAVMLRQNLETEHLNFDAAAFLDLGKGTGVRELTFHDGHIWGISGSAIDGPKKHRLWNFSAGALEHGAVIKPEVIGEPLPNRAEGLAIGDGRAWVLVDGDKPKSKSSKTCRISSTYEVRSLE